MPDCDSYRSPLEFGLPSGVESLTQNRKRQTVPPRKEALVTNSAPLTASAWNNRIQRMGMAMLVLCALTMLAMQPTQAQTYTILHNFTNGADGAIPSAGLTMDRVGNLYGTV